VSLHDEERVGFCMCFLLILGLGNKHRILVSGDKNLVMTNGSNDW
jgi:hypothetical protein